jgi:hypothetical protein
MRPQVVWRILGSVLGRPDLELANVVGQAQISGHSCFSIKQLSRQIKPVFRKPGRTGRDGISGAGMAQCHGCSDARCLRETAVERRSPIYLPVVSKTGFPAGEAATLLASR